MIIKFTWLGTAAYVLDLDGTRVLFDPFFFRNENSSPLLEIKREQLTDISAVLITHAHVDHITDAAWFAENHDIPVYTSKIGKENMIKWCAGEIIDFENYSLKFTTEPYCLTEKGEKNIIPIEWGDQLKITNDIYVDVLKSKHINFDFNTIWSRLTSKQFWNEAKNLLPLAKGLPMGKVFGFCTNYNQSKIVSYGSLYHKEKTQLTELANIDLFIAPLAGNSPKHMAKKVCKMVSYLNPSTVIPIHWDNFFPPISRLEDLDPFLDKMKKNFPKVNLIIPSINEEIVVMD
ncbi:MAG: putative Metal-dependent hydrolase [Promethearchaeota archaeon]|nr:MAG: putative Metal-dependent hydrolase [Candidatus Lokiarchaeota archaeon]